MTISEAAVQDAATTRGKHVQKESQNQRMRYTHVCSHRQKLFALLSQLTSSGETYYCLAGKAISLIGLQLCIFASALAHASR